MNKKNLFLIAGIVASIVFIGNLTETEPKIFFGYSVNRWIIRIGWLLFAFSNFANYLKIKKSEKESN